MVQTLVHENKNLKAKPVTPPPPTPPTAIPTPIAATPPTPTVFTNGPTVLSRTSSSDTGVTMRGKNHVARHCSMYEPREGPPNPREHPPNPREHPSNPREHPPNPREHPSNTRGGTKIPMGALKSASPALPSSTFVADEVHRRTNLITKRIQDVFHAVQERRVDLVEPSAERIVDAVRSMAAVCQQVGRKFHTT